MHLLHRSNDTGHWRGSNDSQKISVRIAPGGSPAADTGHWRGSDDLQKITVGNWLRRLAAYSSSLSSLGATSTVTHSMRWSSISVAVMVRFS